jgi:hypothetical protein
MIPPQLAEHHLTSGDIENINDNSEKGIKQCDIGYLILFDTNDYDKLNKFYARIRVARFNNDLALKNEYMNYYEQFLTRKQQDKSVSYEIIPEPLEVGHKTDRVVFSGLERIADLVTGKTSRTFNYYSIGTGVTPVLPSDTSLDFETHRVAIFTTGFAESKGSSMVFAANFPTTLPSMNVTESGIFDRFVTEGDTMLLRTLYTGSNVIPHIFNQTFVATSHFVYQLSI